MAATSRTRSTGLGLQGSGEFRRCYSPSGRLFYSDGAGGCGRFAPPTAANSAFAYSTAPAFAYSTASAFAEPPPPTFSSQSTNISRQRAASPTRVKLMGISSDRPIDSIAAKRIPVSPAAPPRKTCMCSPTTHPGSFRCSLHKSFSSPRHAAGIRAASSPSNRLNARRSAMTNSLVRIGAVEVEWVKRALAALIRPSSHQQRRRAEFHPQPSRLSVMSKAEELSV